MKGTVVWFSRERGFGFISPYEVAENIFVHRTGLVGRDYLIKGEDVEYDLQTYRGRVTAVNVRIQAVPIAAAPNESELLEQLMTAVDHNDVEQAAKIARELYKLTSTSKVGGAS